MKYIKKFNYKYNVGDYVVLKDIPEFRWTIDLIVKITYVESGFNSIMPYTFLAFENDEIRELRNMEEETIEREATPKEIEKYMMMKTLIKYNL